MASRYVNLVSCEKPSWWMMRICLTIVDLPDSLEPKRHKFSARGLGGESGHA